jgi:hypothetical protein
VPNGLDPLYIVRLFLVCCNIDAQSLWLGQIIPSSHRTVMLSDVNCNYRGKLGWAYHH